MQTKANAQRWYIANSGIAVRKDVAADPAYVKGAAGHQVLHGPGRLDALPPGLPRVPEGLHGDPGGDGVGDDG